MNKPKVLVTDYLHESFVEGLEEMGFEAIYDPTISLVKLKECIACYAGLIVATRIKVDRGMIDQAERLQFIGRAGSGTEFIDMDYAASKGIAAFNSAEGNRDAVAEHAIGMILGFNNYLFRANLQVRNRTWLREENRGIELKGKTLGIIGYGNIGQTLARKLAGFEMNLVAYDKYVSGFSSQTVAEVDMETLFKYSDIVSLHIPLNQETHHLCNDEFFNSFAKQILLVNTARGRILDTSAVLTALKSGNLRGVCLDVLENEDLASMDADKRGEFDELTSFDNVMLSPHVAGWTDESKQRIATVLLQKIHFQMQSVT